MDADHILAPKADLSGERLPVYGSPQLRAAIEGLSPDCPITEQLAKSAIHHADRAVELRRLRWAKESLAATVARDSDLLQVASPVQEDMIQLAAYRDGVIYRLEALELAHSREFRNDVRLAMQLSAHRRREVEDIDFPMLPARLHSEQKCGAYLRRWQESRDHGCPACGARSAYYIAERGVHECDSCRHQRSVREDTLFFGSHVPLRKWFSAIHALLQFPHATSKQLTKHLGISRVATVRQMRAQIQNAMSSQSRTTLLAGLDTELRRLPPVPNAPHLALGSAREIGGLGRT